MRAIPPLTGAPETVVAEDQPEYTAYPAALYKVENDPDSLVVLSRWTFTDEERQAIANGEDLYLGLETHGNPIQPLYIDVGGEGWQQNRPTVYVCPKCQQEFETAEECREHVRAAHSKAELDLHAEVSDED